MARPTRTDGIVQEYEIERGMKVFTVTGNTLRDSVGAYCVRGQQALLNKTDASRYHKLNLIQVGLPDFDEGPKDAEPKRSEGTETAAAAVADSGEAAEKAATFAVRREPASRV